MTTSLNQSKFGGVVIDGLTVGEDQYSDWVYVGDVDHIVVTCKTAAVSVAPTGTIYFQTSIDGSNWYDVYWQLTPSSSWVSSKAYAAAAIDLAVSLSVKGWRQFRVFWDATSGDALLTVKVMRGGVHQ